MAALLDEEVESFHDSRVDEMMIIEIVYGHGRKGQISVKFGDDPKALAEEFVKKYRLKPKSIDVVQHHIEATIEEFRHQNEEMRPQSPPHEDGMDDHVLKHDLSPGGGAMEPTDLPPTPQQQTRSGGKPPAPPSFSGVSPIPTKGEESPASTGKKHHHRHRDSSGKEESSGEKRHSKHHHQHHHHHSSDSPEASPTRSMEDSETDIKVQVRGDQQASSSSSSNGGSEAMFNRMKAASGKKPPQRIAANTTGTSSTRKGAAGGNVNANTSTASVPNSANTSFDINNLKVSTSMAVTGSAKGPAGGGGGGGKQKAGERLYAASQVRNKKRENLSKQKEDLQQKEIDAHRFKMSHGSRAIVEANNYRQTKGKPGGENDILIQFYDEGVKKLEVKRKEETKRVAVLESVEGLDNWSCVRCGYFHRLSDRQLEEFSKGKSSDQKLVCSNCGFEKGNAIAPFKPINNGFASNEHEEKNNLAHIEQLLYRRTLAVQREGGDVYEMLRSNSEGMQGHLTRQRKQWEQSDVQMPFQPKINEYSKELLNSRLAEYKEDKEEQAGAAGVETLAVSGGGGGSGDDSDSKKEGGGGAEDDTDSKGSAHPLYRVGGDGELADLTHKSHGRGHWVVSHLSNNLKNEKKAGTSYTHDAKPVSVGEYFAMPVVDRLSGEFYKPVIRTTKGKGVVKKVGGIDGTKTLTSTASVSESHSHEVHKTGTPVEPGYYYEDREKALAPTMHKVREGQERKISSAHSDKFVDHQLSWRRQRDARVKLKSDELQNFDTSTRQPLYVPKTGPEPPWSQMGINHMAEGGEVIEERLLRKHEKSQRKVEGLRREQEEKDIRAVEDGRKAVLALPHSTRILTEARDRSIEEMWRLLLASGQMQAATATATGGALTTEEEGERLTQLSDAVTGWETAVMDLADVQPALMIPEVTEVLEVVIAERRKTMDDTSIPNMEVDFGQFHDMVVRCLRQREGTGRFYVYAPRKRPDLAMAMVEEQEKECTHHPHLNLTSKEIAAAKIPAGDGGAMLIHDKLLKAEEGKHRRLEESRRAAEAKERRELTFKPRMYKPPAGVVPRYRRSVVPVSAPPKMGERAEPKKVGSGGSGGSGGNSGAADSSAPATTTTSTTTSTSTSSSGTKKVVTPIRSPAAAGKGKGAKQYQEQHQASSQHKERAKSPLPGSPSRRLTEGGSVSKSKGGKGSDPDVSGGGGADMETRWNQSVHPPSAHEGLAAFTVKVRGRTPPPSSILDPAGTTKAPHAVGSGSSSSSSSSSSSGSGSGTRQGKPSSSRGKATASAVRGAIASVRASAGQAPPPLPAELGDPSTSSSKPKLVTVTDPIPEAEAEAEADGPADSSDDEKVGVSVVGVESTSSSGSSSAGEQHEKEKGGEQES